MIIILGRVVLLLLFLLSVYWPLRAFFTWGGRWRILTLVPLVLPAVFVARVVLRIFSEPAVSAVLVSEFLLATGGALALMGLLWLARSRWPR